MLDAAPLILARGSEDAENLRMTRVVDMLRTHPLTQHAYIVFIPEAGPKIQAAHLAVHMRRYDYVCTMTETTSDSGATCPGVRKTNDNTREMQFQFSSMLAERRVTMWAEPMCISTEPAAVVRKLDQQLRSYAYDEKLGKWHGKYDGANDDLVTAVMEIAYWRMVFLGSTRENYAEVQRIIAAGG